MNIGIPVKRFGILCSMILLSVVCPNAMLAGPQGEAAPYEYTTPQRLDDGWEVASLEEVGVDTPRISEMVARVRDGQFPKTDGILLVKDGKLVLEEYFNGYDRGRLHEIHSVTKSIASVLTGIAIDKRLLAGVDDTVFTHLGDSVAGAGWEAMEKDVTLKHLLAMTSGYDCDDQLTHGKCQTRLEARADWLEAALDLPMAYPPGQHWAYNSISLMLIERILYETSGMPVRDFARYHLFDPLGIREESEFRWKKARSSTPGSVKIYGGASMTPRAMAKFGQMVLNGGRWNGRRIVSESWLAESTRGHVTTNRNFQYGYLWWRGTASFGDRKIDAVWAAGNGGQRIFVVPEVNLVAIFTGRNFGDPIAIQANGIMTTYILPAALHASHPQPSAAVDPDRMQQYSGGYVFRKGTPFEQTFQIERRGADLLFKPSGWEPVLLTAREADRFWGTSPQVGDIIVRFDSENRGDRVHMYVDFAFTSWRCDPK